MYMWGPLILRLIFRAFVVVVGFLILSGRRQHRNHRLQWSPQPRLRRRRPPPIGSAFPPQVRDKLRIINMVVILQILTILASRGNVYVLGEAMPSRDLEFHL